VRTSAAKDALVYRQRVSELLLGFSENTVTYTQGLHTARVEDVSRGLLLRHSCYVWSGFVVDEAARTQKGYVERLRDECDREFRRTAWIPGGTGDSVF
jgi:hypothetical protein